MAEKTKNKIESADGTKSDASVFDAVITLISPKEKLVKKEASSIVVRNAEGKLVRRTDRSGSLPKEYDLIKEGETFVREEENRIVVRNEAGKLVGRKKVEEKPQKKIEPKAEKEIKETEESKTQASNSDSGDLRARLMARHSFLGKMERGEKVTSSYTPAEPANNEVATPAIDDRFEDIEEIEDIEDIAPDAEVLELERAVTKEKYDRDMGRGANKGVRTNETVGYVSGGAKNPNEKPSLKGSATGAGLVGEMTLATPEKIETQKPVKTKKIKKPRKPIKPWWLVLSVVLIYVIGLGIYFFANYNFNKKQVNIVLYYIDIGEGAKLEYYDGEKFNSNDMLLTYYFSDEHQETYNISERHFAETTIGMGYGLNKGHVNALWIDSFAGASSRSVKVKFVFDNLICYVPITIYRNKLDALEKTFELNSLTAGQELYPTIFGTYTNKVLEERNEKIRKELNYSAFDLYISYKGNEFNLKENACFDGIKYVMPATLGGETVDYSDSSLKLYAVVLNDGFNQQKSINLYQN